MDQKFWDKIDSFRQNREYDKIISKIKEEIPEFWDKMDISEEDGEYDKAIREIKNLPADNTLSSFFSVIETKPCNSYINNAYNRYRRGNPPGKDNKYGDAINWECLLDVVPNDHDLYFISADKDYCSSVSPDKMHPFLIKEWKQLKNSNIYFYSTIKNFQQITYDLKEIVV